MHSSVRTKLMRSNSCASKGNDQRDFNSKNPNNSSRIWMNEKPAIIQNILKEIKQEKPLGKCPLYKMALTFSSFVWSDMLSELHQQNKSHDVPIKKPQVNNESVCKSLVRSHSATSFKSTKAIQSPKEPRRDKLTVNHQSIQTQSVRKDETKLNMLSTAANCAIKLRTHRHKHDSTQTSLISQRSLKLGAIPKYLTTRKVEWAVKEEERLKNFFARC